MDGTLDDVEFLVGSNHRMGVLTALSENPRDRDDLRNATGASSPTMGRVLSDFEARHWIEREGRTYRLTGLGEFVADRLEELAGAMKFQQQLRQVWPWLPHDIDGFSAELFSDVVVSRPGPGYPYQPIERVAQLIEQAHTMCGFGMPMLKSGNLEPFFDRVLDDLNCEYIYPPAVFEELLSWDESTVTEAATRPNYTVLLHDDLPVDDRCGISLFEDRVSICCYDRETGTLQSVVDTESDEMRAWAESYYKRLRKEARPLGETDDLVPVESPP